MNVHVVIDDVGVAKRAVAGGATVVQVRLKHAGTATRAAIGRRLRHLPAMLVINDDVEAALQCRADGVHLGQTDRGAARALDAGLLLGVSARDLYEAEAAQAIGATYIGAGPVWSTPTKPDAGFPIGIDGLAAICAAVCIPVVAIGGVDTERRTLYRRRRRRCRGRPRRTRRARRACGGRGSARRDRSEGDSNPRYRLIPYTHFRLGCYGYLLEL